MYVYCTPCFMHNKLETYPTQIQMTFIVNAPGGPTALASYCPKWPSGIFYFPLLLVYFFFLLFL